MRLVYSTGRDVRQKPTREIDDGNETEGSLADFFAKAAADAVKEATEGVTRQAWLGHAIALVIGVLMGIVTGYAMCTSNCNDSIRWNPLSKWRALRATESNLLLAVLAPDTTAAAKVASGALVSAGAGILGDLPSEQED